MQRLPDDLAARPFSTTEARTLGVSARDLRNKELHVLTRGSRVKSEPTSLTERALAYLVALRAPVALSHISAAMVWGIPLPAALERQSDLNVMCGRRSGPVRRDGCIGHRGLERRRVVQHPSSVAVTSLADTWVDLGVDLGEVLDRGLGLDDLVVAGDVTARLLDKAKGAGDGVQLIRTTLDARVRPRGKVMLDQALALVSPRAKSPMETRARLMFHRGGLPTPELNVAVEFELADGSSAGWMLEGDFVWRDQRVIGEYQGKHHRVIGQRAVDVARRHLAEDEDWTFVEIFAGDVYTRPKRIAMLRRLARALGVPESDLDLTH
ncbi:hypothetical protein V6K52_08495 [Knoellia sp. S7-12]|uniref:hypothetical protein n=1 Tax=Knoellia sp. S7-12 TaxID=3126698 RepID=UPI00336606CC